MPAGSNPNEFDEAVLEAVKQFQRSNGSLPDGMVGSGTRRILNGGQPQEPVASPARIKQILVNMERWRWLPHDLGAFYVTVNIPEFVLRVVDEGTPIHTTRVVVGKPDKQTPVISDEMEEVVFNPYWNVPNSIKMEEIAPYMGYGGGFFGGGVTPPCFSATVFSSDMAAATSIQIRSIGAVTTSAISIWFSRRDPATCSAASNSCSPTSTTSTCTTRRKSSCSTMPSAPRVMAACACNIPRSSPRSS